MIAAQDVSFEHQADHSQAPKEEQGAQSGAHGEKQRREPANRPQEDHHRQSGTRPREHTEVQALSAGQERQAGDRHQEQPQYAVEQITEKAQQRLHYAHSGHLHIRNRTVILTGGTGLLACLGRLKPVVAPAVLPPVTVCSAGGLRSLRVAWSRAVVVRSPSVMPKFPWLLLAVCPLIAQPPGAPTPTPAPALVWPAVAGCYQPPGAERD